MPLEQLFLLTAGIGVVAFLYSSVGHAGASGYIAVMTLFSLPIATIKPAALSLNILVATIATIQFWRAGYFSWQKFWPFAVLSIPMAFLGGYLNLPARSFKIGVGSILLLSALKFIFEAKEATSERRPALPIALGVGAILGLLAGLTGTGGGIFLTPLMIIMGWATTKTASAISALFILANSICGLAGNVGATNYFPPFAWPMFGAALLCGTLGSYLGSNKLSGQSIKRLLAAVLTIAGLKLILAA